MRVYRTALAATLVAGACSLSCGDSGFTDDMAGVARLSVAQVALLAQEISKDEACGFESAAVKAAVMVEGAAGSEGRAIYRVEDCTIGFASIETVLEGCSSDPVVVSGRAHVTATLEVTGVVTTRSDPIIPAGPDALKITLENVILDGFSAQFGGAEASLVMREGSLSAVVKPRLARANGTAFCSIPTGDTEVRDLAYVGASLIAKNDDQEALVFVARSNIFGQIGQGSRGENTFGGQMTVGGQVIDLPLFGQLDDDYNREEFEAGFGCGEDLARPLDYACECTGNRCDPDAPVADGVGRLLPFVFGNIVALAEADERCGFSSSQLAPPTYDAALGQEGLASESLGAGCRLEFSLPYRRDTDCRGVSTYVEGVATVSGSRTVRGVLTGDVDDVAAIPTAMDALDYELSVQLENFRVWTSSDTPSLLIESGSLTGTMRPTLALNPRELACVAATPHTILQVRLNDAAVQVIDGDDRYSMNIDNSVIEAVVGQVNGQQNMLQGTVTSTSQEFIVPSDNGGLDPDFDLLRFDEGFSCDPEVAWPTVATDCSLAKRLAPEVARAAAVVLATATRRVVTDEVCGVASVATPVAGGVNVGTIGSITSSVSRCTLVEDGGEVVGDNCFRTQTFAEGNVHMSGTREARGEISREPGLTVVIPRDRTPYRDRFTATFEDYRIWSVARDADTPSIDVLFRSGLGSVDLTSVMGENDEALGAFDVSTPVARFSSVTLTNVDALLASDGRHFAVAIDDVAISVATGVFEGRGNTVSGYVVLGGERVDFETSFDDNYEQEHFDAGYACTPSLLETIPPN